MRFYWELDSSRKANNDKKKPPSVTNYCLHWLQCSQRRFLVDANLVSKEWFAQNCHLWCLAPNYGLKIHQGMNRSVSFWEVFIHVPSVCAVRHAYRPTDPFFSSTNLFPWLQNNLQRNEMQLYFILKWWKFFFYWVERLFSDIKICCSLYLWAWPSW